MTHAWPLPPRWLSEPKELGPAGLQGSLGRKSQAGGDTEPSAGTAGATPTDPAQVAGAEHSCLGRGSETQKRRRREPRTNQAIRSLGPEGAAPGEGVPTPPRLPGLTPAFWAGGLPFPRGSQGPCAKVPHPCLRFCRAVIVLCWWFSLPTPAPSTLIAQRVAAFDWGPLPPRSPPCLSQTPLLWAPAVLHLRQLVMNRPEGQTLGSDPSASPSEQGATEPMPPLSVPRLSPTFVSFSVNSFYPVELLGHEWARPGKREHSAWQLEG